MCSIFNAEDSQKPLRAARSNARLATAGRAIKSKKPMAHAMQHSPLRAARSNVIAAALATAHAAGALAAGSRSASGCSSRHIAKHAQHPSHPRSCFFDSAPGCETKRQCLAEALLATGRLPAFLALASPLHDMKVALADRTKPMAHAEEVAQAEEATPQLSPRTQCLAAENTAPQLSPRPCAQCHTAENTAPQLSPRYHAWGHAASEMPTCTEQRALAAHAANALALKTTQLPPCRHLRPNQLQFATASRAPQDCRPRL